MTETAYEITPEYSLYWLKRQDGVKPPPPFHDGYPQPGLYRTFGDLEPVRIIELEGKVLVLVNEVVSDDPNQVWLKCGRNDVSFEAYNHRVGAGCWPGAAGQSTPGIGDNKAPELPPEDALPVEVEKATEWLATVGELKSDVEAHNAANRAATIAELRLKVEKIHKAEKEPFLRAGLEVDARFLPKTKSATEQERALKNAVRKWDDKKKAAFYEAKKAAISDVAAIVKMPEPPPPASYGNVGRKVSVKAKPIARIADQDAVYKFFRDDQEIIQLLQKLAQREVDHGNIPPGVEKDDGSVAR